ncbi:MAG: NUDIX domain-containing protein [Pseudomonadota bacterium]
MKPIFFYGSLRDHDLLEIVLDRPVAAGEVVPAIAPDHMTCRLVTDAYPILVDDVGAEAHGCVLLAPTDLDIDRMIYFEEAEYGLVDIQVETEDGPVAALYFRGTDKQPPTDLPWNYAQWRANDRAAALHAAREYMSYYSKLTITEVDALWKGIMDRAHQRARAEGETVPRSGLRSDYGPADLLRVDHAHVYSGFLAVEEHTLRHKRFDGSWTEEVSRTVAIWGDAAVILPYDPKRDRVMLIEQFRAGPSVRRDPNPWCIEVIAGRIEPEESAEATARREAAEEGGVEIGRIAPLPAYYPSPGLVAEKFYSFVGEADLPGDGGLHGNPDEGEDIRTLILPFEEAQKALMAGEINTAIGQTTLYWLLSERHRLQAEWT